MFLQRFTIKDAQGNESKAGITVGDAIHDIGVLSFVAFLLGHLWVRKTIKRELKNIKVVDRERESARNNAAVRLKYIAPVLMKEHGRSWQQLLYMQLKKEAKGMLLNLLSSQKDLNEGRITIDEANSSFTIMLASDAEGYISSLASGKPAQNNILSLDATLWRHIFQSKVGFTWLTNFYNGWNNMPNGKIGVLPPSKEAELKYEEKIERITDLEYCSVTGGYLLPCDCELVWMFDNHMRAITDVLNEIFEEHPEFKSTLPVSIS
jgi:hypothetical protein